MVPVSPVLQFVNTLTEAQPFEVDQHVYPRRFVTEGTDIKLNVTSKTSRVIYAQIHVSIDPTSTSVSLAVYEMEGSLGDMAEMIRALNFTDMLARTLEQYLKVLPKDGILQVTEYTHPNGLDAFYSKKAGKNGWIVRCTASPCRFYQPCTFEWVLAHQVGDWTPFLMSEQDALNVLATLEVPQ